MALDGTTNTTETEVQEPSKSSHSAIRERLRIWDAFTLNTWFWDVISLVFSIFCFAAILGILAAYDQRASPSFPHGLTLNTIVSVLATGSKSSLIFVIGESIGQLKWVWFHREQRNRLDDLQSFDDASRGQLGAMTILIRHRGSSLVSLGALITLLALAFDPFMQQILSYPVRQVESPSTLATTKQAIYPFEGGSTRDLDFTSAIQAGIWTDSFDVAPTCPSGNCTWPTFQSTGWCTKCEDVTTDALLIGCDQVHFDNSSRQEVQCSVSVNGSSTNTTLRYTSPGTGNLTMKEVEYPRDVIWNVSISDERHEPAVPRAKFLGESGPLLVLAHAKLSFPYPDKSDYIPQPSDKLVKLDSVKLCIISMCSRQYTVSVHAGTPSIIASPPDYGSFFTFSRSLGAIGEARYECWKPGDATPVKVTQYVSPTDSTAVSNRNSTEFTICNTWGTSNHFIDALKSTVYQSWWYNNDTEARPGWHELLHQQGSNVAQKVRSLGLEKTLHNIAASLNKLALENSNVTKTGTATISQAYVKVDWTFIILPAVLLVLGIVFLVSTVVINHGRDLGLWKSSVLPVLYHGLEDNLIDRDTRYSTTSDMQRSAKQVDVKLQPSHSSERLVLGTGDGSSTGEMENSERPRRSGNVGSRMWAFLKGRTGAQS